MNAGVLLPEGTSLDVHISWSIETIPKSLRDRGEGPWWKLAVVALDVDLNFATGEGDVVAGEAEIGFESFGWRAAEQEVVESGLKIGRQNVRPGPVESLALTPFPVGRILRDDKAEGQFHRGMAVLQ